MNERVLNTSALPLFLDMTFKTDRVRVRKNDRIITIEPIENKKEHELRAAWINRLNSAINLSSDEELPDIPRETFMRTPVDLSEGA